MKKMPKENTEMVNGLPNYIPNQNAYNIYCFPRDLYERITKLLSEQYIGAGKCEYIFDQTPHLPWSLEHEFLIMTVGQK